MLVRIGAVQAMAAPAPIRLSILRLEMPSVASLLTGSTRSPPPQLQKVPGSAQRRNVRLARTRAHDAAAVSSFHRGARFSYGSAFLSPHAHRVLPPIGGDRRLRSSIGGMAFYDDRQVRNEKSSGTMCARVHIRFEAPFGARRFRHEANGRCPGDSCVVTGACCDERS